MSSIIRYLDTKETVTVETPITIRCGWGDRTDAPGAIAAWTEPDANGIKVTVEPNGTAKSEKGAHSYIKDYGTGPTVIWPEFYPCDPPSYFDDVVTAHRACAAAAISAEQANPAIAKACADYRAILADIHQEFAEHERLWREVWMPAIAKKFRRKWVEVGEQTVPGLHCVRSRNGNLLGYAKCWDGRWLGTIERL